MLLPNSYPSCFSERYAAISLEAARAIYDRVLLHAQQFMRPLSSWQKQLNKPNYHCYLLLAPNIDTGALTLEESQWVGMFALEGPLEAEAYNYYNIDNIKPNSEGRETRWLGLKLYLEEQHRNLDATQLLRHVVTSHIKRETRSQYASLANGKVISARLQSSAYIGTTSLKYHAPSSASAVAELTRRQDLEYDGYLNEVPEEFLGGGLSQKVTTVFEMWWNLGWGKQPRTGSVKHRRYLMYVRSRASPLGYLLMEHGRQICTQTVSSQ